MLELVYEQDNGKVLRCTACGAAIVGYMFEFEKVGQLSCPICTNSDTNLTVWTKEEIATDPQKAYSMMYFEKEHAYRIESKRRAEKRGLSDDKIWRKELRIGRNRFMATLECENFFHWKNKGINRLRGLLLRLEKHSEDKNGERSSGVVIPLSKEALYFEWIFPYQKTTIPCLRKYWPWQKNTDKRHNK